MTVSLYLYSGKLIDILLKTVENETEAFSVMREYIKINNIFSMTTRVWFTDFQPGENCKVVEFGVGARFIIRVNSTPMYSNIEQLESDIMAYLPCNNLMEFDKPKDYPLAYTLEEFDAYSRHSPLSNLGDGCDGRAFKAQFNYNLESNSWKKKFHLLSELRTYFDTQGR